MIDWVVAALLSIISIGALYERAKWRREALAWREYFQRNRFIVRLPVGVTKNVVDNAVANRYADRKGDTG